MPPLEALAALLIVINVALVARRSILNYAFGIAGVIVYAWVFYDARLYSDALLQLFFLAAQLYGWANWARAQAVAGEVVVERLSWRARARWLLAIVLAALGWGALMARYTDAASPLLDASVAMASVAAQLLMARRKLENWYVWVLVNALSIVLYASRGLWWTFALYCLLLVIAVWGLVQWRQVERVRAA